MLRVQAVLRSALMRS